ncbi:type VI secretion system tube protein TssD [Aquimarina aquimarini]|uniref:type VI secretion system tube protein TssD n=1 Tax=Aquimarina aquimarini TaxID=1191734 RepID=UPI001F3EE18E|nr:type VI secretion system tube protein TssD [Aquimarina aquimarini]
MATRSNVKFYIDGYSVPVLSYTEQVHQQTDFNGMPSAAPQTGIYRVVVPDTGRWTHLLDDWALSRTMRKECKIEEQSFDGYKMFKTLEFLDTFCIHLEYVDGGTDGPIYILVISAATVVRNGEVVISKWWRKTDPALRNQNIAEEVAEERNPEILKGWWSHDKAGKDVYNKEDKDRGEIPLGETMYFHVQTRGLYAGEQIKFQLYDYDHFFTIDDLNPDTSEFPYKPVKKTATVDNHGIATVELLLDEDWESVISDDNISNTDTAIELYWQVRYESNETSIKKDVPASHDDHLQVGFNDRTLFIKHVNDTYGFPEMMNTKGDILFFTTIMDNVATANTDTSQGPSTNQVLKGLNAINKATKAIDKAATWGTQKIALTKLERGQLVDNYGKVYTKSRKIYTYDVYTNEGKLLKDVKKGKPFGYKHQGDPLRTIKGTSQVDYFAKNGTRVQLIGIAKHVGTFFDFYNILDFAAKDTETAQGEPLPIPHVLGLATIPIIAQSKAEWDEDMNMAILHELEQAKTKGLNAVRQFVNSYSHTTNYKWKLIPVSKETADKTLKGEFRTFEGLEMDIEENPRNRNIELLYRRIEDKSDGFRKDKYVIETLFINE